jgi:hypothetical protein
MTEKIKKKYGVKLNNVEKIEQLLQETYDLACQQHKHLQDEINKISNTTILNDLDIDGKEKYGKIMSNYISLQQKSINQKYDIAKLMAEVLKHGGNIADALKDDKNVPKTFDIAKLKELANSVNTKDDKQSEHYDIK